MNKLPGKGDFGALLESFATASADPSLWEAAMDTAAQVTGSVGAILLPVRGPVPGTPYSQSIGGVTERYFREGWDRRDERTIRAVPKMIQHGVVSDLDFATSEEIARNPYYQEFLGREGLRWFAGVKIAIGEDLWCLSIQRSTKQGPFSPDELRGLSAISGGLSSAAATARARGFARAQAALDAFDTTGAAVVLLDRRGEVSWFSRSAGSLFGSDIHIAGRHLVCSDTNAMNGLSHAIHKLVWERDCAAASAPIVIPRQQGRPIVAYASRSARISASAFAPCQVVIVLVDLEMKINVRPEELRVIFGLTPAESRLAVRLARGESIDDAAKRIGISYDTSRNVLKSIFQKTETHRQGELVALLARLKTHLDV